MNGYLNILKPTGMTSSNVVSRVKYILKTKKVGHAGTLDPLAVGVLPIMLGKATKMFDYLNLDKKVYVAEFTFGIDTNTLDVEGTVENRSSVIPSGKDIIEEISKHFIGEIEQIPPKVSAVNINGQRAYNLARAGIDFEIKPKKIKIYKIELLRQSAEKSFIFRIDCSKGTYVRSLCKDLACNLDTYAYVSFLVREKSGFFGIEDAVTLEQLESIAEKGEMAKYIISVDEPISYMDEVNVPIEKQTIILNGGEIKIYKENMENVRVYCGGDFIGIGRVDNEYLKIKKMFYG